MNFGHWQGFYTSYYIVEIRRLVALNGGRGPCDQWGPTPHAAATLVRVADFSAKFM